MKPSNQEKEKMYERLREADSRSGENVQEIKGLREKIFSLMLSVRGEQEGAVKLLQALRWVQKKVGASYSGSSIQERVTKAINEYGSKE